MSINTILYRKKILGYTWNFYGYESNLHHWIQVKKPNFIGLIYKNYGSELVAHFSAIISDDCNQDFNFAKCKTYLIHTPKFSVQLQRL